jgi:hypothetical protein
MAPRVPGGPGGPGLWRQREGEQCRGCLGQPRGTAPSPESQWIFDSAPGPKTGPIT